MPFAMDRDAASDKPLDTQAMLRDEFAHVLGDARWTDASQPLDQLLRELHAQPSGQRPSALCLSGGGIRSATFSLGVLQWLARQQRLQNFHYLSTVSGGGYIGSWLVNGLSNAEKPGGPGATEWLHRVGNSAGSTGAASAAGGAKDPVAPLRAFSNYLSPTGGLSGDAFSLVAIFIRNLLLNALVWLPLLAALVALPRLYIAILSGVQDAAWFTGLHAGTIGMAIAAIVFGIAYIVTDLPAPRDPFASLSLPTATRSQALTNHFHLACFTPIVLAAILLSIAGAGIPALRTWPWQAFALAGAGAHLLGVVAGVPMRIARGHRRRRSSIVGVGVVVLVGAVGGALASVVLSQLGVDPAVTGNTDYQHLVYASFAVPAMTGAFWLAMALYAGLMGRFTDEQDREWWARATAAWLKFSLGWVAVFVLIVWLPLPILDQLGNTGPTAVQFGIGGGLLGVLTSIVGYWGKNGGELKRKAKGFIRVTRMRMLDALAGLVVLAILLALSLGWNAALERCHGWAWTATWCATDVHAQTERLRATPAQARQGADPPDLSAPAQVYRHVLLAGSGRMLYAAVVVLLLFASVLARAMGANHFSLHGMYGNRLVRAYLGSGRAQRNPHWFTGFDPDDNPKLATLDAPLRESGGKPRLYPLINIALNLVRPSPSHLDWQQRKAASFIATPRHCGAAVVGYRPTGRYAGGMSLGRALTISGAAASPNMGYHSSALVTFVMTLFNVRLGWWSPNPNQAGTDRWEEAQPWLGLDVAIAEARGSTGEDDRFVYLSDGGHFDNLGIYEMVRRRCHHIVAVDATCDGTFKWNDLLDTVRKIRVDFGIPIELPAVLPGPGRDTAHPRCVSARIRYSARDGNDPEHDGTLIVLKPRLMPLRDPPELAAYAADSAPDGSPPDDPARFPHQSTADQFFDEQQFESYRLLGYQTAADTLGGNTTTATTITTAAPGPDRNGAAAIVPPDPLGDGARAAGGLAQPGAMEHLASAARGSSGGLGQLVNQIGSGAALAGALTVGGTLGVVGTVALAPPTIAPVEVTAPELTLSRADRDLIRDGLSVRVDTSGLKLDDNDRRMLGNGIALNSEDRRLLGNGLRVMPDAPTLAELANRLSLAAKNLDDAAGKLGRWTLPAQPASAPASAPATPAASTVALDPALTRALQDLQSAIRALDTRMRNAAPGTPATDPRALTSAVTELRQTLVSIEAKLPADPKLSDALTDLKHAIESIAPRRNVRGQN